MIVLVTGSCGLIGSESAAHFGQAGYDVVGVDNDMRSVFFGPDASTAWVRDGSSEVPGIGTPRPTSATAPPWRRSSRCTAARSG